jgi:hypothetical protein
MLAALTISHHFSISAVYRGIADMARLAAGSGR